MHVEIKLPKMASAFKCEGFFLIREYNIQWEWANIVMHSIQCYWRQILYWLDRQ